MIVSDSWLDACGKAGYFLPAKSYLVKDKAAERQHTGIILLSQRKCFACYDVMIQECVTKLHQTHYRLGQSCRWLRSGNKGTIFEAPNLENESTNNCFKEKTWICDTFWWIHIGK